MGRSQSPFERTVGLLSPRPNPAKTGAFHFGEGSSGFSVQNSSKLDEPSGETPPLSLPLPELEFSPTGGPLVVVVD